MEVYTYLAFIQYRIFYSYKTLDCVSKVVYALIGWQPTSVGLHSTPSDE